LSKQRNETIARRWYEEMWSEPDLDVADEIVDKNYDPEWVHIDAVGSAQIKHEIRYFRSIFPDLKYEILDLIGDDEKVWIRFKGRGKQMGNAWGFEATGREVEFEGVTILYINSNGMVSDRWGAFCFYDILTDLGLVPHLWNLSERLE